MHYRITARYGHRYHLLSVEAEHAADALRQAADLLPLDLLPAIDLVELRIAVEPGDRPGADGESPPGV
jgi:hypothetical protein